MAEEIKVESAAFAKDHTQQECLDEAIRRYDNCADFACHLRNNIFLLEVLRSAQPTPGFCDEVPGRTDIWNSAMWRVQKCQEIGRPDQFCHELFGTIQKFCS